MATIISEFHGAPPLSAESRANAAAQRCPFVEDKCIKPWGGACSLRPVDGQPVIICRNRLYGSHFSVVRDIATECFGGEIDIVTAAVAEHRRRNNKLTGREVVIFGQGFGGEVGIKAPSTDEGEEGTFKIDYLLCRVDNALRPIGIAAVEVQTIDTTNNYSAASAAYYGWNGDAGFDPALHTTTAGYNWENVTKRILPQIIYKGHALRREQLAQHGLFFVLPRQVFEKIKVRVGGQLLQYPKGPGTVTFKPFELAALPDGTFGLKPCEEYTTTVEQLAFAFVSPANLPPLGVYETTLSARLADFAKRRDATLDRLIEELGAKSEL